MNSTINTSNFFQVGASNATIGLSHISLFMVFYQLWIESGVREPLQIKRFEVMQVAKISSATYHKCLKRLVEIGLLGYEPSTNPDSKSKVFFP